MNNFTKFALTAAIALTGLATFTTEAKAGNMNCFGNEYMQTCTYSTWKNGQYVSCYGTITQYNENWNCY